MADNYTQFSFGIELKTDSEIEWAEQAVSLLVPDYAQEPDTALVKEFSDIFPEDFEEDSFCGFDVEVNEGMLWVYTQESGTPSNVVPLVQAFLKKFNPEGYVTFTFAETCSKPRLNEFGGGAVFITATNEEWFSAYQWQDAMTEKHPGFSRCC